MITKILGLFLWLAAWSVSAQTNQSPFCCRYPLRTLGEYQNQTVDLSPLFQWWSSHGGQNDDQPAPNLNFPDPSRPLTAWKRITGIKTAEYDYGWVVDAEISISPTSRTNEWIILRHPPAAEEAQYYNLQAQIAQFREQIAHDMRTREMDLKDAERVQERANRDEKSFSKSVRNYYGTDLKDEAKRYRNAADAALNDQKQSEQTLGQAQELFNSLPNARNQYVLDCFALEVGRNSKGQRIFDAGLATGYSQ